MSLKHTLATLAIGSTLTSVGMAQNTNTEDIPAGNTPPTELKVKTQSEKFAQALIQNAQTNHYRGIIENSLKNGVNPKDLILGLAREESSVAQEVLAQSLKNGTLKYDIQQIYPKSKKEYTSLKQCGFDATKEVLGYAGKKAYDNHVTAAIEQDVFNRTYYNKHLKAPPQELVEMVHTMMKDGIQKGGQKFSDDCKICLNNNPEWHQALLNYHQVQQKNTGQIKRRQGGR